jgi:hypothetical protein
MLSEATIDSRRVIPGSIFSQSKANGWMDMPMIPQAVAAGAQ